jgi:hypothetical protein
MNDLSAAIEKKSAKNIVLVRPKMYQKETTVK